MLFILVAASIGFVGLSLAQSPVPPKNFRVSLSVSPFTESVLRNGVIFSDGGAIAQTTDELQRMFKAHGANEVYARIATTRVLNPGNGDHSVNRGLERAVLAKALSLPFNPEIGLWKAYGDITCQPSPDFRDYPQLKAPGEWTSLRLDQMLPILRAYGAMVAREILNTGVQVRIWDLGNEVDYGMAGVAIPPGSPQACASTEGGPGWYKAPNAIDPAIGRMSATELRKMSEPERIAWLRAHLWPHLAKMFAAVADGIRSVDPKARFSTHLAFSRAPAQCLAFFTAMRMGGFFPDELGFSYYPTSSRNTLQAFKETATTVHRELGRPVFLAEFGYPADKMQGPFAWNTEQENYALNSEGQAAFTRDLVAWGVETGVLSGIRPWAPDLIVPVWGPMSLFALDGKTATARPALDAIAAGLRSRLR